jgi:hypothetical protein
MKNAIPIPPSNTVTIPNDGQEARVTGHVELDNIESPDSRDLSSL